MNKFLFPIVIFIMFSTQFSFSQNRKVKLFENEMFSFSYSKKWRILSSNIHSNKVVLEIAPKYSIHKSYRFIVSDNGSDNKAIISEISFKSTLITVDTVENDCNIDCLMNKKRVQFNNLEHIDKSRVVLGIKKLNNKQFVKTITYLDSDKVLNRYYFLNKNKIYSISFSLDKKPKKKYLEQVNLIINSFNFKI